MTYDDAFESEKFPEQNLVTHILEQGQRVRFFELSAQERKKLSEKGELAAQPCPREIRTSIIGKVLFETKLVGNIKCITIRFRFIKQVLIYVSRPHFPFSLQFCSPCI